MVVPDGPLEMYPGCLVIAVLLVDEGQIVLAYEHVIVLMLPAAGISAVFAVLISIAATLISCSSCPSKEKQVDISLSLKASQMTLSLSVVMESRWVWSRGC